MITTRRPRRATAAWSPTAGAVSRCRPDARGRAARPPRRRRRHQGQPGSQLDHEHRQGGPRRSPTRSARATPPRCCSSRTARRRSSAGLIKDPRYAQRHERSRASATSRSSAGCSATTPPRDKTEIVLSITPHIIRTKARPPSDDHRVLVRHRIAQRPAAPGRGSGRAARAGGARPVEPSAPAPGSAQVRCSAAAAGASAGRAGEHAPVDVNTMDARGHGGRRRRRGGAWQRRGGAGGRASGAASPRCRASPMCLRAGPRRVTDRCRT